MGGIIKALTGIEGLDQVTMGGIPAGRPTLICGNAGCGKTTLSMQTLINGARDYGEPGLFISFEESASDLTQDFSSLFSDLPELIDSGRLRIEYIEVSPTIETGSYNLEGLFARIEQLVDSISARRIVLDTLEAVFGSFPNRDLIRSELHRLFNWLKKRGLTAIITGEAGINTLTRWNLEEYISDCVINIDHRIEDQISTRRLRIIKYRGSLHGTNEYPFLIVPHGIEIIPITAFSLDYQVSTERISTGIKDLDAMFSGAGFFKGSSVLATGTAGTGKTSLAISFAASVCRMGKKVLYFTFEESASQLQRNAFSFSLDLSPFLQDGSLEIHAERPSLTGLEQKLYRMIAMTKEFRPDAVVIDPISNLITIGSREEVKQMLSRFMDTLKADQVTCFVTSLTSTKESPFEREIGITSVMDTWMNLAVLEETLERITYLSIVKSRGMNHSKKLAVFTISDTGINIVPHGSTP